MLPATSVFAYATFNSINAGEQICYLDSAIAWHMTPNDGKLLTNPFTLA